MRFAEEADEGLLNRYVLLTKRNRLEFPFYRYRDSEVIHGRAAMLAILGQLVAERYHPVMPEATGTAWEQFVQFNEKYPVSLELEHPVGRFLLMTSKMVGLWFGIFGAHDRSGGHS